MDFPEYRAWKRPGKRDRRLTDAERASYDQPGGIGSMTARQYWNMRDRGSGGTFTTGAEENTLGHSGSTYCGRVLRKEVAVTRRLLLLPWHTEAHERGQDLTVVLLGDRPQLAFLGLGVQ